MTDLPAVDTYEALQEAVAGVLAAGKERARQAVEAEKVQTYWQVGRLLHGHLQGARAEYGAQAVERLAAALGLHQRTLYQMRAVYQAFPILNTCSKLSWSQCRLLAKVPKSLDRRNLAKISAARGWSVKQLRQHLERGDWSAGQVEEEAPAVAQGPALRARRGDLFTYRLVADRSETGLALDLGFGVERAVAAAWTGWDRVRVGQVVCSLRQASGFELARVQGGQARRHAYRAVVERVVDADTLLVRVDLGFGVRLRLRLRLRGVDAPERPTAAGQRARAWVETRLQAVDFVVLRTFAADKYGRYLADVFFGAGDVEQVARQGVYLNGLLVREGLARWWAG